VHWRNHLGRLSFPLIPCDITEPHHLILTDIFQEPEFTFDYHLEFRPLVRTPFFKLIVRPKHESQPARLHRKEGTTVYIWSQPVIETVVCELPEIFGTRLRLPPHTIPRPANTARMPLWVISDMLTWNGGPRKSRLLNRWFCGPTSLREC
jgi:hypothetical protein